MLYKLGDVIKVHNKWVLLIDLIDSEQPDSEANRGCFQYDLSGAIHVEGNGPLWLYDEGFISEALGNIYDDGIGILENF